MGADGYVARLGGDEFAVLLPDCADPLRINALTTRIFKDFQASFELAGQLVFVGTSIGIAMAPRDAASVEALLCCADMALYSAKSDGGGTRKFFAPTMQNQSEQRHRLSVELRRALARGEFELWYQPQVCLADKSLSGVEALLRWRHPERGLLTPDHFMAVLEDSVIAEEVGIWVLHQACRDAAAWRQRGLCSMRIGVNLFAAQLRSRQLLHVVSQALETHDLAPDRLELEITETTVLRHNSTSTEALKTLKGMGVSVAFDDFGTGFASLSLLQQYPITRLKIDRTFVSSVDRRVGDAAIVNAVVNMALGLGLEVIAEGVETEEQETALLALHCAEAQGYLYGRPMPASEIAARYGPPTERYRTA